MAALLQARKPEHRRINRLSHGQKPMVLQKNCFLRPQRFRDVLAFLFREHDTLEGVVNRVVVVECAAVIRQMDPSRYKRQKEREKTHLSCVVISNGFPNAQYALP